MVKLHCAVCKKEIASVAPRVVHGLKTEHLECFLGPRLKAAFEGGVQSVRDEELQVKETQQRILQKKQEEQEQELLGIYQKGAAAKYWTPKEREQLVAAKMICVHCGKRINVPGVRGSGAEGKHCSQCYMASQYGETQAAQSAAKSAASIEAASKVLSGATPPVVPPVKKQEEEAPKPYHRPIDLD